MSSPSFTRCFLVREPCFGLPCLLFALLFATVLALLALLDKFQRICLRLFRCFFVASPSFTGMVFPSLFFAAVLATSFLAFHWHGASFSGSHVLGCRVCFSACFLQPCWQCRFTVAKNTPKSRHGSPKHGSRTGKHHASEGRRSHKEAPKKSLTSETFPKELRRRWRLFRRFFVAFCGFWQCRF